MNNVNCSTMRTDAPKQQPEVPTLRDIFAIAAFLGDWASQTEDKDYSETTFIGLRNLARSHYEMADAMMEVRNE